ncbi:MAG: RNA polymerase sigma-54 factor [Sulfobacillus benefaciens]|uniref:RNA polymerase sigma-54 factor n=1 Tax=Sulfobacillus benefaciens TaxID=453960 RepID=A0A2T2X8E7_9FIRM|nr:MAG: RNA polymerase sigma-54 factor [Sulfobacillus benefaciens]
MLNHQLEDRLNQSQNLAMTPQMVVSLKVLALSGPDLASYLQELLLDNPVVELTHPDYARALDYSGITWAKNAAKDPTDIADPQNHDLYSYVEEQIRLMLPLGNCRQYALFIAGNLNPDGYLRMSTRELAQAIKVSEADLFPALRVVQQCDPAGIGARSLQECLYLQALRRFGASHLLTQILQYHWDALKSPSPSRLAKTLKLTNQRALEILQDLRLLQPKPGAAFGPGAPVMTGYPDIQMSCRPKGEVAVEVLKDSQPSLSYVPEYKRLSKTAQDPAVTDFLAQSLKQARWVQKALRERQSTLQTVGSLMVVRQRGYCCQNEPLLPLTVKEMSQTLGFHESTIRRAIADKILICPRGFLPLSSLLCEPATFDHSVSVAMIKDCIQCMIRGEDPAHPLSDAAIAHQLEKRGVWVARRTVAKYRQELGLLAAHQRRQQRDLGWRQPK